jgi:hypothetical protein
MRFQTNQINSHIISQFNSHIILYQPTTNHKDSTIKGYLTIGVALRVIHMAIGITVNQLTNRIGIRYKLLTKYLWLNRSNYHGMVVSHRNSSQIDHTIITTATVGQIKPTIHPHILLTLRTVPY